MNALVVQNHRTLQAQAFDVATEHLIWCEEQDISPEQICAWLGFPDAWATHAEAFAAIVTIWMTDKLVPPTPIGADHAAH